MKNRTKPQFLQDKLNLKGFPKIANFPQDVVDFMIEYETFYNWNLDHNISKIYRAMKNGVTTIHKCGYKGCEKLAKFDEKFKLTRGCCRQHSTKLSNLDKYGVENVFQLKEIKDKIKKDNLEKYGVEFTASTQSNKDKIKTTNMERYGGVAPACSEEVKDKMKSSMMKNHGVEFTFQSDELMEKVKKTNLERYGDESFRRTEEYNKRAEKTYMEKYGVSHSSKCSEVMYKNRETCLERYGVEFSSQHEKIKEKVKSTNLERYGCKNVMHNAYIFTKHQNIIFKRKEYKWRTGEISIVQGYEPIVLKELEDEGYTYNEVLTQPIDMPEILYEFEDSTHRYYPDIFNPKENRLIEVKSEYTLQANWDKNQAKFKATRELGFNFDVEVR